LKKENWLLNHPSSLGEKEREHASFFTLINERGEFPGGMWLFSSASEIEGRK